MATATAATIRTARYAFNAALDALEKAAIAQSDALAAHCIVALDVALLAPERAAERPALLARLDVTHETYVAARLTYRRAETALAAAHATLRDARRISVAP